MSIKQEMKLLARHEGQWKGTYIHVDADGQVVDRHASLLTCTFPEDGPHPYQQTNEYTWEDGKTETYGFPGAYKEGKLWFDTERIIGAAWEVDETTIYLTWNRRDIPGASLHEMIQLSPDGQHRTRTWHWLKDGEVYKRTLIKEQKVL